ncbi:MAG: efflux RND transporter periplasmic adaptor subunit [Pirellulales bacterium]
MSSDGLNRRSEEIQKSRASASIADSPSDDEGGLRAPPDLTGWRKAWWWFHFLVLVKLARLRFIAVLIAIGLIITQWDALVARYEKWTRPASDQTASQSGIEYFCPMHPSVIRDNSKEKCPICFMPLSKRKKGDAHVEALPAGVVNRVQLSPYRIVLAGVKTWSITRVPLTKRIHAVGYVEFNERDQRNVSARVSARIDELFVNETGQMVAAGDRLALLYSPELQVTVQNLLDARNIDNAEFQRSARTRLELLGIDNRQIEEILSSGQASRHLTIRSPISGHVIRKYVREGDYVNEGSPLYDIADLSTVWILAQVYEDDMAFLPLEQRHEASDSTMGLPVVATTPSLPNEDFHGVLTFIYPHVDQATRTITVRCELPNPGHKLRPGSTATITIQVPPERFMVSADRASHDATSMGSAVASDLLAVPEGAVIDTGSQTLVYRQTLPDTFDGVAVTLGPKMSDQHGGVFYPVLDGLKQGDQVVTAGSFLIDAETRLNPAAGSIYFGGSGGSNTESTSIIRPSTPENTRAKIEAALASLAPADRAAAAAQRSCPILANSLLGSMGPPVKLSIGDQTVFVCCGACKTSALADPQKTIARVAELIAANQDSTP